MPPHDAKTLAMRCRDAGHSVRDKRYMAEKAHTMGQFCPIGCRQARAAQDSENKDTQIKKTGGGLLELAPAGGI